MGQTPGGWNHQKMLQALHDTSPAATASGGASSKTLADAILKPISWTSCTVSIVNAQVPTKRPSAPLDTRNLTLETLATPTLHDPRITTRKP
jgi:hypothetical protein